MAKRKRVREKGKIRLSRYFKNIENKTRVAIVVDKGLRASFPKRLQGNSGVVKEARGKFKVVEIKEGNKVKKFIIHPVHLKIL